MKKLIHLLPITLALMIAVIACKKEKPPITYPTPNLPDSPYNYSDVELPQQFQFAGDNTPFDNPTTDDGATLGRVLFYDRMLSLNNAVACASCHSQKDAFADPVKFSTGFEGKETARNSMAIVNLRFQNSFFWDLRASTLEQQVMMPIQNHIEMGMEELDALAEKLAKVDYYPPLFEATYGDEEITPERLSKAMSQFLRSMVTYNSKYDQGLENNFVQFNSQEQKGKDLFFSELHCGGCHADVNLGGWGTANIGLDIEYTDRGMGDLTGSEFDEGQFKIPPLKNIELTGPYMHDGRFETLEEVVDHYNDGVENHQYLDWRLQEFDPTFTNIGPLKLDLSDSDKEALIAFMKTLTDDELRLDPKFANPFSL